MEAILRNNDFRSSPFIKLMKHGRATLINVYTRKAFPFDSLEVKALL
jgi:hypothetical protein